MWHAVGMKQTSETTFEPDWLALREPADHAARDTGLLVRASSVLTSGKVVLDLGSGTGSTARAFAAAGHADLSWRFFDRDAALLSMAKANHPGSDCVCGSLVDLDSLPLENVGLITASALLDLMSADWVATLAGRLASAYLPFYAALNYDGVMTWTPGHQLDQAVTAAFNRHQGQDKGFGSALGPVSGEETVRIFREHGFKVASADSPWTIRPDQTALHNQLLSGIGKAAGEAGEEHAEAWLAMRYRSLPQSTAIIGHTDILALPPEAL